MRLLLGLVSLAVLSGCGADDADAESKGDGNPLLAHSAWEGTPEISGFSLSDEIATAPTVTITRSGDSFTLSGSGAVVVPATKCRIVLSTSVEATGEQPSTHNYPTLHFTGTETLVKNRTGCNTSKGSNDTKDYDEFVDVDENGVLRGTWSQFAFTAYPTD